MATAVFTNSEDSFNLDCIVINNLNQEKYITLNKDSMIFNNLDIKHLELMSKNIENKQELGPIKIINYI